MKKAIFPLIIICVFLSSCSKSDDVKDESLLKSPLLGTWRYFGYTYEFTDTEVNSPGECETKDTYVFREDGTYEYSHHSHDSSNEDCEKTSGESGNWEQISDDKVKFTFTDEEGPYSYESEYVLSEDVLSLSTQEGSSVYIDKFRRQ